MLQDTRFAIRLLRKSPGFTFTAILMLALGMGASVSIFAFVDAALIRPLPYADQSRLMMVYAAGLQRNSGGGASYLEYRDWRDLNRSLRSIDAYDVRFGSILGTGADVQRVPSITVTAGFFRTLGVTPALGRDFRADEEGDAAQPTVMLSYAAWQSRFGGKPDIVGQTVTIDDQPHLVIGVLPQTFHFTLADPADFWITVRGGNYCRAQWDCRSMQVVGRLADGVSIETAKAEMDSVARRIHEQHPSSNSQVAIDLVPLRDVMMGDVRPILIALLSGAALLLLIACLNVSSLLLVRADGRTREIAVRDALGASSARLVMQFVTESLLLVAAGAASGLLLAMWGMRFLTGLLSADMLDRMPYLRDIGLNAPVLTFAAAVALFAAVVFALTPIVRMSMSERAAGLREGTRGSAGATWRRLGAHLVVAELAIAVVLLVSAGLLSRSLQLLMHVDTGLNPDRLAALSVGPAPVAAKRSEILPPPDLALARDVADRVSRLPGVEAVGYADQLPISRSNGAPTTNIQVPGRPYPDEHAVSHPIRRVSAGYFAALQARMLRGRAFTEAEVASTRRVVIINQTTAERYFGPDEDPIGREINVGSPPARQIVGVVADLKDASLEAPARPAAYVPFDQTGFTMVVRMSQDGESQFRSLVATIRDTRPGLVISRVSLMTNRIDQMPSAYLHRSSAWLVGGFAAMAFFLSVMGLYGVIAYSVSQRHREIGVRIALGAHRRMVYRMILTEAGWLTIAGIALGMICAVAAASLMRGLLFGVGAWDAPTLIAVAVVLAIAALFASYIPARRAASVNPIDVLRAE